MLSLLRQGFAVDLGTSNTLLAVAGKGIVVNEPSVIALDKNTKEVIAVGEQAREMLGKAPENITAHFPLEDGVIHDFDTAEAMLRYFLQEAKSIYASPLHLIKSHVVVGVPSSATEVEVNALRDAAYLAGAGQVSMVLEPLAVNALLVRQDKGVRGRLIVDIGGGTSDIVVVTMHGIVADRTVKVAGNEMTIAVRDYIRDKYNMLIGFNTAEQLKRTLGNLNGSSKSHMLHGRDLATGYPKAVSVKGHELTEPLAKIYDQIIAQLLLAMESTSPEILSDILSGEVVLTGGGALIGGVAKYVAEKINAAVVVANSPLTAVVEGLNYLMQNPKLLSQVKIKQWELI